MRQDWSGHFWGCLMWMAGGRSGALCPCGSVLVSSTLEDWQLYCILTSTMCREPMVRAGSNFWCRETRSETYKREWQPGICFNSMILWKVVKVPLNGLNVLEFNNNMMINGSIKEISLLTDILDKIFYFKAIKFLGILHQLQRTRCDNNWMLKQKKVNDDDL